MDNSAGGQVWVPDDTFGPLAGLPLHLSYGRCKPFVLLRQECDGGIVQGGVAELDVKFLSGVCRGRFATGRAPLRLRAERLADGGAGRRLPAARPLHRQAARRAGEDGGGREHDPPHVQPAARREERGRHRQLPGGVVELPLERRVRVEAVEGVGPEREGQDEFAPRSAKLLDDGRTVELTFEKLGPVMQMQVGYNLTPATAGRSSARCT